MQIDSPVSGGVTGAEKGTLAVMVSGPRAEIEAVEPALKVFGKVFLISERPGAGQTMKLANNFLSATAMAATSEAIVMGVKAGLDPRIMIDVINAGTGRNTATEDKFPNIVMPRKFNLGFTNGLMMKDVKLVPVGGARRSACRWRWRKRWRAPFSSPATRSVLTATSPPSCSRSNGAPASRCAHRKRPTSHERRHPRGLRRSTTGITIAPRRENFIGGDPHDVLQPLDYLVWAIVGKTGTIIVDTGFDAADGRASASASS